MMSAFEVAARVQPSRPLSITTTRRRYMLTGPKLLRVLTRFGFALPFIPDFELLSVAGTC